MGNNKSFHFYLLLSTLASLCVPNDADDVQKELIEAMRAFVLSLQKHAFSSLEPAPDSCMQEDAQCVHNAVVEALAADVRTPELLAVFEAAQAQVTLGRRLIDEAAADKKAFPKREVLPNDLKHARKMLRPVSLNLLLQMIDTLARLHRLPPFSSVFIGNDERKQLVRLVLPVLMALQQKERDRVFVALQNASASLYKRQNLSDLSITTGILSAFDAAAKSKPGQTLIAVEAQKNDKNEKGKRNSDEASSSSASAGDNASKLTIPKTQTLKQRQEVRRWKDATWRRSNLVREPWVYVPLSASVNTKSDVKTIVVKVCCTFLTLSPLVFTWNLFRAGAKYSTQVPLQRLADGRFSVQKAQRKLAKMLIHELQLIDDDAECARAGDEAADRSKTHREQRKRDKQKTK